MKTESLRKIIRQEIRKTLNESEKVISEVTNPADRLKMLVKSIKSELPNILKDEGYTGVSDSDLSELALYTIVESASNTIDAEGLANLISMDIYDSDFYSEVLARYSK